MPVLAGTQVSMIEMLTGADLASRGCGWRVSRRAPADPVRLLLSVELETGGG